MLERLNEALALVERDTAEPVDAAAMARIALTSEHHLRRLFATLAGVPLATYVRRRRLTLAGDEVVDGDDTLLEIAVRYGYGSAEAFSRAFRAMHGVSPGEARRTGAVLATQPRIAFRLTIEGSTTVHHRIVDKDAFRLIGPKARVPIVHLGRNVVMEEFLAGIDDETTERVAALSDQEPHGLVSVTAAISPDREEGSEIDYHLAAATSRTEAGDLPCLEVPAGTWVVFPKTVPTGDCPEALQVMWRDAYGEWFPAHPAYRTVPGPELLRVTESDDGSETHAELWIPVERV